MLSVGTLLVVGRCLQFVRLNVCDQETMAGKAREGHFAFAYAVEHGRIEHEGSHRQSYPN
jgi:hypothetical protein